MKEKKNKNENKVKFSSLVSLTNAVSGQEGLENNSSHDLLSGEQGAGLLPQSGSTG